MPLLTVSLGQQKEQVTRPLYTYQYRPAIVIWHKLLKIPENVIAFSLIKASSRDRVVDDVMLPFCHIICQPVIHSLTLPTNSCTVIFLFHKSSILLVDIEKYARESRLSSFTEAYKKEFEDWMKRRDMQIIQTYSNLFDDELKQAETFAKNGEYDKAAVHAFIARAVNDYMKTLI